MNDLWVQIDSQKNILFGPGPLPFSMSGYSAEELHSRSWFHWTEAGSSFNPSYQYLTGPTLTYSGNYSLLATYGVAYLDLNCCIANKQIEVNAARDGLLRGGWIFNGNTYDSDPTATQNIAGTMTLINTGYILPDGFTWRSKDNVDHSFTNENFTEFFIAATMWREAAFRVSWYHKANIAALTTSADVMNYDYTTGWVKGYNVTSDGYTPIM